MIVEEAAVVPVVEIPSAPTEEIVSVVDSEIFNALQESAYEDEEALPVDIAEEPCRPSEETAAVSDDDSVYVTVIEAVFFEETLSVAEEASAPAKEPLVVSISSDVVAKEVLSEAKTIEEVVSEAMIVEGVVVDPAVHIPSAPTEEIVCVGFPETFNAQERVFENIVMEVVAEETLPSDVAEELCMPSEKVATEFVENSVYVTIIEEVPFDEIVYSTAQAHEPSQETLSVAVPEPIDVEEAEQTVYEVGLDENPALIYEPVVEGFIREYIPVAEEISSDAVLENLDVVKVSSSMAFEETGTFQTEPAAHVVPEIWAVSTVIEELCVSTNKSISEVVEGTFDDSLVPEEGNVFSDEEDYGLTLLFCEETPIDFGLTGEVAETIVTGQNANEVIVEEFFLEEIIIVTTVNRDLCRQETLLVDTSETAPDIDESVGKAIEDIVAIDEETVTYGVEDTVLVPKLVEELCVSTVEAWSEFGEEEDCGLESFVDDGAYEKA
ncbi:hypothetical protein HDU67_007196 [Dinochytrium kinnereticum]|nr:hypothetical protein HDU67_007196 [Dinochytrium kinnereticum]